MKIGLGDGKIALMCLEAGHMLKKIWNFRLQDIPTQEFSTQEFSQPGSDSAMCYS